MKAIWKGSINFGLVTIKIELFSAVQEHVVSFKLLHDACHTPIHNVRWCATCEQEVAWENVVKGLPTKKGDYFIITQKTLESLKSKGTDTIHVETFIASHQLEFVWLEQHYYALPYKKNDRAYELFVAALEKSKKMGLGRFIMREKEHVCVILPYHNALLLSTLHFPYQIRPLPEQAPKKIDKKELELAQYLIETLSAKKISADLLKDTFIEQLKKEIVKKTKKTVKAVPRQSKHKKLSLLQSLEESVKSHKKTSSRRTKK
jgi:DNA end-binding protein Ku